LPQHSFEFTYKPVYSDEEYVISTSNRNAHSLIIANHEIVGIPPYNRTLILRGPKASGKTHLANMWVNQIPKNRDFISSCNDIYDNSYTGCVIDDAHTLSENELFHIINYMNEEGRELLMVIEEGYEFKLKDLRSRISAIRGVSIEMPDESMVRALLVKHFSTLSLMVSSEVIDFLEKRTPRSFFAILSLVLIINKISLQEGREITVPFVREVVEKFASYESEFID
jgi:chromosomal replication initiation ATPase DnaA